MSNQAAISRRSTLLAATTLLTATALPARRALWPAFIEPHQQAEHMAAPTNAAT